MGSGTRTIRKRGLIDVLQSLHWTQVRMRVTRLLAMLVAIAALAAIRAGAQPYEHGVDGINAVVHDSVVTFSEVADFVEPAVREYARQYRGDPSGYNKKVNDAIQTGLKTLVDHQLILHEFDTAGYNLPESIIDQQVHDEEVARFPDRATMTRTLQTNGITYEEFRRQVRDRLIIGLLTEKNISSVVIVSPHKVETYYQQHQDKYKVDDEVKLRMIVLDNRSTPEAARRHEMGEEIRAKIKDGASFAEEATMYSAGVQKHAGGDWGWVGRNELLKELEDVAFKLNKGDLSDVIDTPDATYLMLVEDKRPAHVKPLADVRDEIDKTLQAEEQNRLQQAWLERLRKKTFVRIHPE